eukprot:7391102-Heterocapsa_arctica.AAC.1
MLLGVPLGVPGDAEVLQLAFGVPGAGAAPLLVPSWAADFFLSSSLASDSLHAAASLGPNGLPFCCESTAIASALGPARGTLGWPPPNVPMSGPWPSLLIPPPFCRAALS